MQAENLAESYPFPVDIPDAAVTQPLAILLLLPFIVIFLWAGWLELRRWWRYGARKSGYAAFAFGDHAPNLVSAEQAIPAYRPATGHRMQKGET